MQVLLGRFRRLVQFPQMQMLMNVQMRVCCVLESMGIVVIQMDIPLVQMQALIFALARLWRITFILDLFLMLLETLHSILRRQIVRVALDCMVRYTIGAEVRALQLLAIQI